MAEAVSILNCKIDNITLEQLLKTLSEGVVFTPNVDHLVRLQEDIEFYHFYSTADYRICDSKILQISSKFLKIPICEKISGSDFFPSFCSFHKNNSEVTVFLLGSKDQSIVSKAQEKVNKKVGRTIVIEALSPSFGFEKIEEECLDIVQKINASKATVLAVGVGSPKQEKWIMKYKHLMPNIKIFMGIGATIDFEAGAIKRAPKWMSYVGLEWLYRLLCEPRRLWKRYLKNIVFFFLIFKQKLGFYRNPWV
ncbi:MAG: glycosyltransferase [Waddliaceae bacterium]|nr:glycosyltransferase [Waddliaceae bacterium]